MRVLWISPLGRGLAASQPFLDAGHTVVGFGEVGDALPLVKKEGLYPFGKTADLLVIDSPFPLVKTPSSWRPSQESLFIEELRRHYGVRAIGATPTIDLLHGDPRYFRKWCRRLSLPYGQPVGEAEDWRTNGWWLGGTPDDLDQAPWIDLFKQIGFEGYFTVGGQLDGEGRAINWCDATLPAGDELLKRLT